MSASNDTASPVVTVYLRVLGRVQGVGYRAWCVHAARQLGLTGWVRNVTDGSVEATLRGPHAAVETLIAAAQAGPPAARVTEVRSTPGDPAALLPAGFHHLPTES